MKLSYGKRIAATTKLIERLLERKVAQRQRT